MIALVTWAQVDNVLEGGNRLQCKDLDTGGLFTINGSNLVEQTFSADVYESEKKITKTQAAELLVSSFGKPFSVTFEKTDGETRTLRGRLVKPEPLLGRSMVEDLDIPADQYRLRQVDHRTISSLVLNGVKYTVK